ncbi:methyltransferase domain-containing protein [Seohaeicola saemankumensis]|nr:methyltransferase domain-containing protein [Seohaeicola saemankumensis]MCA0871422.1 methyltransferase domain-containing protein [Seohaeicola saemankumensis]
MGGHQPFSATARNPRRNGGSGLSNRAGKPKPEPAIRRAGAELGRCATELPLRKLCAIGCFIGWKGLETLAHDPFYKAHWRNIEPDRMSAYREGFGWNEATERLFKPARISEGHTVADFGCGPGKISVEIGKQVGSDGHVHAIDINAEFLEIARENAVAAGVSDRLTTHLKDGVSLPLSNSSLDRISARNAIMYVDDPLHTLREFHRVLRPGGLAHAIDGDWYMMVAEPIAHDAWRAFVEAASHACRNSDMGRKLYAAFVDAGFQDVDVSIVANADVDGRLLGMVRNMAKYAVESGTIDPAKVERVIAQVEQAHCEGEYLVVSPQFVVTGRKAD